MTRSRLSSLIAIACIALTAATAPLVDAVRYCWNAVTIRLFGDPTNHERTVSAASLRPRVTLVSAKAFRERLAKRERPRVFEAWRMCPGA